MMTFQVGGDMTQTTAPRRGERRTVQDGPSALTPPPRPSSFALKQTMAISGLILGAFVFVHMLGNLKVYEGAEAFNSYAVWLRTFLVPVLPETTLLWVVGGVLALCLVAHVWSAVVLSYRAKHSRGKFARRGVKSFTARTMPVTGTVLALFVVFHVLDLTFGTRPAAPDGFREAGAGVSYAYQNLIASFQRPVVAAFYILAMALLGAHLFHGLWLAINDLGATGKRFRQIAAIVCSVVALVIMVGNISIPIAVWTGMIS
jgi:succinate dehydrogenase / fumarate reductase cytochrome b subunit